MKQEINYARSGDISIAYSVIGSGPIDLVLIPGFESHLEFAQEDPDMSRLVDGLASFTRLITFDKRGTGLSDRGAIERTIERYMADTLAVMDAAGSESPAIFGVSEGGATALLFAATYPERTSQLIVYGGFARVAQAPDYPQGLPAEVILASADFAAEHWGTGVGLSAWAPSQGQDEAARRRWAQFQRLTATPRDVKATITAYAYIDVRHALSAIGAPTLVLHRREDRMVPIDWGRYIADHIPGAKFVELEGADHLPFTGHSEAIIEEVQEFLTGARVGSKPTRKLATILFTDIVGSTGLAASLGDKEWRAVLERHDAMIRRALERFSGKEIKTTGDGFLALFEGPTAAIRCAQAVVGGASALGCEVRAGLHTGEVEVAGEDVSGIAVHIARRVADLAGTGEIWVSSTVPGVVFGSGVEFDNRGTHSLKGVPGEWSLHSVETV